MNLICIKNRKRGKDPSSTSWEGKKRRKENSLPSHVDSGEKVGPTLCRISRGREKNFLLS